MGTFESAVDAVCMLPRSMHRHRALSLALVVVLAFLAVTATEAVPPKPEAPPALPESEQILLFLNRTLAWYERVGAQADLADQPTDILYVNDNRQLARQVVALSFESAKAQAQLIAGNAAANPTAPSAGRMQRMAQRAASTAGQLRREQDRLESLQQQLVSSGPADTARLTAAVAEAESRVAMAKARNEAISGIVGFANGTAGGGSDLLSQINALEQTITTSTSAPAASAIPAAARKGSPSSVVELIGDLMHLNQKDASLNSAIQAADSLQRDARVFTAPLMAMLTETRKRTDALMSETDTSDPAELLRRKTEIDALSIRFREVSAATTPLAKRRILLRAYETNVGRWRGSVLDQYHQNLRRLIYRGSALAILLLLVAGIAILWRRITYRYVADVKRRHHFLLIRRIVLLILVAGILVATFASDFSSLTTFLGLVTAGVAIALQDVILSLAGYFVIIGKYGIRAGDRVRIASVNGDVLDVGLVWIYLMELETRGTDQLPTGRIVEFPNSVVFDHSAGIFKQLPGTRFLWHEVSLSVPSHSDFRGTQERMLAAVESVFADYESAIDRQHRDMDRLLGTTTAAPRPHSRLRVAPGGVEIRVRYPVEIEKAGDIDDRIAAAVAEATQQNVTGAS